MTKSEFFINIKNWRHIINNDTLITKTNWIKLKSTLRENVKLLKNIKNNFCSVKKDSDTIQIDLKKLKEEFINNFNKRAKIRSITTTEIKTNKASSKNNNNNNNNAAFTIKDSSTSTDDLNVKKYVDACTSTDDLIVKKYVYACTSTDYLIVTKYVDICTSTDDLIVKNHVKTCTSTDDVCTNDDDDDDDDDSNSKPGNMIIMIINPVIRIMTIINQVKMIIKIMNKVIRIMIINRLIMIIKSPVK